MGARRQDGRGTVRSTADLEILRERFLRDEVWRLVPFFPDETTTFDEQWGNGPEWHRLDGHRMLCELVNCMEEVC